MGIKKKHVPGCTCCGATGCCLGAIPSSLTVVLSGQTASLVAVACPSVCGGPPSTGQTQCTQIEGTWVIAKTGAADSCTWNTDTTDAIDYECLTPNPSTGNLTILDVTMSIQDIAGVRTATLTFTMQCPGLFDPNFQLVFITKPLGTLSCASFGLTFDHSADEFWSGLCYLDTLATITVTA